MHQSAASSRHLSIGGSMATSRKLLEKRKEYEGVVALAEASDTFLKRIEALSKDLDDVAAAGQVMGEVLEQWPSMFRILGLILEGRDEAERAQAEAAAISTGDRLVRVPVDELGAAGSSSS
ncbi:hypothetical protein PUNSTDRAFT_63459 [Punctularia strigosozonata HHB-11173 SS5]|uniref:uncharacterized protein n=1 Tax=Punctularia strigosozonata (strain HHB-11173) TaxID=741275 RepID=UPI0004416899|nr:uncharacterized protein PUNSTDRAFT_63459 [Punctularia strigosozonata HHB-11173 SS5]EIN12030.1 hypothetical protein PUNSTDRAFT_63459 [Punctularia strigosozonata HHB-11173 SS5]